MRLASCSSEGDRFAALVAGDSLHRIDPQPLGADTDFAALAGIGPEGRPIAVSEVELLPVVPDPRKIICLGLNYRGHVAETQRQLPTYPVLFTKFADSLIGPFGKIVKPPESDRVDFEAELVVVIGRPTRRVAPSEALAAVAGYTIGNDVSMRDFQSRSEQWLQGKSWPRTTPIGPHLVGTDALGDARGLDIRLSLNGEEMQSSNTERMIFDVATAVATVSEFTPLGPGDLILMGTPDGIGARRDPQVFLQPGDIVRAEIDGIGAIENEVVAED